MSHRATLDPTCTGCLGRSWGHTCRREPKATTEGGGATGQRKDHGESPCDVTSGVGSSEPAPEEDEESWADLAAEARDAWTEENPF